MYGGTACSDFLRFEAMHAVMSKEIKTSTKSIAEVPF